MTQLRSDRFGDLMIRTFPKYRSVAALALSTEEPKCLTQWYVERPMKIGNLTVGFDAHCSLSPFHVGRCYDAFESSNGPDRHMPHHSTCAVRHPRPAACDCEVNR